MDGAVTFHCRACLRQHARRHEYHRTRDLDSTSAVLQQQRRAVSALAEHSKPFRKFNTSGTFFVPPIQIASTSHAGA